MIVQQTMQLHGSCFIVVLHLIFDDLLDVCRYLGRAARPTMPAQASSLFKLLQKTSQHLLKYR